MRKIAPLMFEFRYLNDENSVRNVKRAYDRIFSIAYKRILDSKSTQKYNNMYEELPNPGGGSGDVKSEENYGLPDGQGRQDPGSKGGQGLEGGQWITGTKIKKRDLRYE